MNQRVGSGLDVNQMLSMGEAGAALGHFESVHKATGVPPLSPGDQLARLDMSNWICNKRDDR